jgi:hypothetical protein
MTWSHGCEYDPGEHGGLVQKMIPIEELGDVEKLKEFVDYFLIDGVCPTQEELDKIGFPYTSQLNGRPQHNAIRFGHFGTVRHMRLLCEEALKVGSFDVLVRWRNDLSMGFPPTTWLSSLKHNSYAAPTNLYSGGGPNHLNDHMGFAFPEEFLKIWNASIEDWNPFLRFHDFESGLAARVGSCGLEKITLEPTSYIIRRSASRGGDWKLR